MGHVLVGTLQKAFAGKTGSAARIGQLLANNLIVAPIQTFGVFYLVLYDPTRCYPVTDLNDHMCAACLLGCHSLFCFPNVTVYLACMSIIGGAYTTKSIMGGVKAGYMKVLKVRNHLFRIKVLFAYPACPSFIGHLGNFPARRAYCTKVPRPPALGTLLQSCQLRSWYHLQRHH